MMGVQQKTKKETAELRNKRKGMLPMMVLAAQWFVLTIWRRSQKIQIKLHLQTKELYRKKRYNYSPDFLLLSPAIVVYFISRVNFSAAWSLRVLVLKKEHPHFFFSSLYVAGIII
jgi:hypothetical protein